MKTKKRLVSLRFTILSVFIALFVAMTALIIALRSIALSDEINYTSLTLMEYVSEAVLREITTGIQPVEMECQFSANLLQSNVLQDNPQQLVQYTFYLVKTMPLVRGAFWGDENGSFVYSHKENDGSITSEVVNRQTTPMTDIIVHRDLAGNLVNQMNGAENSFDPRTRPWYIEAKQQKKTIWTDIYSFYPHHLMGISVGSPVYAENGMLRGVFGADVSLDYLTQFVNGQKVTKNGYSFIITNHEDLVAYPDRPPFQKFVMKPGQLINVHAIKMPLIDQSIDLYKQTHAREISIYYQDKNYLITYRPVPDLADHGWLIGVVTPRSDFIGFLKRINFTTLVASVFILMIGIYILSTLVTWIVRPIHALVKQTERIKRFELDKSSQVKSRIKEVMQLQEALIAMKNGLKHFQRYLPKTLVQQLIASGQDIRAGGDRKQLVVLFSDIQGFTTIAESIDPNQLMLQVCEYFETLSGIITAERGTIDKYIGDSVMAFWGAPVVEKEAWYHAARAALQIEKKLAELNATWVTQEKPPFITRIGLHVGEAIVGNIGSSERLNYTALGDTINITSRLENINKNYKTKILVSDIMYQLIKDKFVLRLVDCVVIVGRTKTIYIYELLGENPAELSFDIIAYNKKFELGFDAYQEKNWQEALMHFQQCLVIYPEDGVAPIFIERCQQAN